MNQTTAQKQPEKPQNWNFNPTNETKILAFSGKLGAGKTSCSNYIHALAFVYMLGITKDAAVNENGKLVVMDDKDEYQIANIDSKEPEVVSYLQQNVWPVIKKYSCADPLKKIAIDVLGLDENLVYGSQEDKNTLTHLRWEDMPTVFTVKTYENQGAYHDPGYMSIRDILEYVGTELFRKMYPNCWADALIRTIKREKPQFAVIDDVRFLNEVEAIQNAGGKIIRLTLTSKEAKENKHRSNVELDEFNNFDYILENGDCTIEDAFRMLLAKLIEWEWFKVVS